MSPRFVLGRENVPRVAEVVNRSLKADCTDFKNVFHKLENVSLLSHKLTLENIACIFRIHFNDFEGV